MSTTWARADHHQPDPHRSRWASSLMLATTHHNHDLRLIAPLTCVTDTEQSTAQSSPSTSGSGNGPATTSIVAPSSFNPTAMPPPASCARSLTSSAPTRPTSPTGSRSPTTVPTSSPHNLTTESHGYTTPRDAIGRTGWWTPLDVIRLLPTGGVRATNDHPTVPGQHRTPQSSAFPRRFWPSSN